MTNEQADLRQKMLEWLTYGDEDLRLAEHALTMSSSVPYRLVAYHAQQCAEKHLKAFLVLNNSDFPYTRNISTLLEFCSELADWPSRLESAEVLTAYAVTVRYPGETETVSKSEAEQAIVLARKVRAQVRKSLEEQGAELSAPDLS